jgi:glycosyltransferase involved in cell wall biosynthesis
MIKEKKIAIISTEFPPSPGGIGNHANNLAKFLQKNSIKVDVITKIAHCTTSEILYSIKRKEFRIVQFPRFKSKFKTAIMRFFIVFKAFKRLKYSHVICTGRFSIWIGAFMHLFFSGKYIAVTHGGEIGPSNFIIKLITNICLNRFHKIICVSNYTKKKLSFIRDKEKITVIPNGIDISEFATAVQSREKSSILGDPVLLTVGSVWFRKGQHNVINALPFLLKKYPHIHYHCAGLKSEMKQIYNLINKLNLKNNITFHGKVSEEKLRKLYKGSDIFIMLSESKKGSFEGFGIVLLEANLFGIPTIGSINCGIEDAINDHKSGILVDPKNPYQILNAVTELIKNKDKYRITTRKWAIEHSWDNIIKKYLEVLDF